MWSSPASSNPDVFDGVVMINSEVGRHWGWVVLAPALETAMRIDAELRLGGSRATAVKWVDVATVHVSLDEPRVDVRSYDHRFSTFPDLLEVALAAFERGAFVVTFPPLRRGAGRLSAVSCPTGTRRIVRLGVRAA